ncbi:ubiquinol oxidase subunit II [Tardiphaga alba]|uniref:Ubiquinol oxidase subunit 2 n=1 Tax=Tardiphaga alba TaxID=340268 RepID=A0ABX8AHT8_9BRAD|nr:ubiquinol oxidase subunit II [Tardiphaga alba]QUS41958.1 ubiquinol oxidase subunit II [Tardiphaga alba]
MRYGLLACLLTSATLLSGCTEGVLDPKGPIAMAELKILINALGIMLAIVIPVIVAIVSFAIWFRATNERARYRPDFIYSGRLELLVWSIPAMTVLLVGGVAWIGAHELDPPKAIDAGVKPVHVQVVSLDWKWLFIYPEQGIASVNRLVVPVDAPIRFELTSSGVMNSFFVPQLGSQIYTMSGMTTHLYLKADQVGSYPGFSAMFSGDGFSDMRFNVDAVTDDRFAQWVRQARDTGAVLDRQSYAELVKPSIAVTPRSYRSVASDLFGSIVDAAMATQQAGQDVCLTSQRAER